MGEKFHEVKGSNHKKGQVSKETCPKAKYVGRLDVRRRFTETLDAIAFFPLSALTEKLNAFEAFEDVAFNYESFRTLEAFVLRHDGKSK